MSNTTTGAIILFTGVFLRKYTYKTDTFNYKTTLFNSFSGYGSLKVDHRFLFHLRAFRLLFQYCPPTLVREYKRRWRLRPHRCRDGRIKARISGR